MDRRSALTLGALALSLAPAAALAQPVGGAAAPRAEGAVPSRVRIERPACADGPVPLEAWQRLLRTELESDGVESVELADPTGAATGALAVISVEFPRCEPGAAEAVLRIDDLVTRKQVRRTIDLADVPAAARARTLALAVSELLRASWAELALPDAPTPSTPLPSALQRAMVLRLDGASRDGAAPLYRGLARNPPTAAPEPGVGHRWTAGIAMELRSFPSANAALLGARSHVGWSPVARWPLRVRVDLGFGLGTAFDRAGEIDLGIVSGALAAVVHGSTDRVIVELGPRAEAGWAWVQGRPFNPSAVGGSGGAAVLFASVVGTLRVRIAGRWWAGVDATAGSSLRPVSITSGDQRAAGFLGPVVSLGIGLSATW